MMKFLRAKTAVSLLRSSGATMFSAALAVLAAAAVFPAAARAASAPAASSTSAAASSSVPSSLPGATDSAAGGGGTSCGITPADLAAVRTAEAENFLAGLDARRALLARTIGCAESDAQNLKKELDNMSLAALPADTAREAAAIRAQLSGRLAEAVTYYDLELQKTGGAGAAGVRAIAGETLAFRVSNYEPLAENIGNFELWVSSQPLFAAAESRLSGIENLVAFFEQAGVNNSLQSDLASAQASMYSAKGKNRAAEDALLQFLPPAETRALIQESLNPLSGAYGNFFDIAKVIQSLLPSGK